MPRAVCAYCTMKDDGQHRSWYTVDGAGGPAVRLCSIYCLADWAAEQEKAA